MIPCRWRSPAGRISVVVFPLSPPQLLLCPLLDAIRARMLDVATLSPIGLGSLVGLWTLIGTWLNRILTERLLSKFRKDERREADLLRSEIDSRASVF